MPSPFWCFQAAVACRFRFRLFPAPVLQARRRAARLALFASARSLSPLASKCLYVTQGLLLSHCYKTTISYQGDVMGTKSLTLTEASQRTFSGSACATRPIKVAQSLPLGPSRRRSDKGPNAKSFGSSPGTCPFLFVRLRQSRPRCPPSPRGNRRAATEKFWRGLGFVLERALARSGAEPLRVSAR